MENSCAGLENEYVTKDHLNVTRESTGLNNAQPEQYCSVSERIGMPKDDKATNCLVERESLEHTMKMLRAQIARLKRRTRNPCLKSPHNSSKEKCLKNYVKRLKIDNVNLRKQVAALKGKQNVVMVNDKEVLEKQVFCLQAEVKFLHSKLNAYKLTLKSMHGELEDKKKFIYVLNSKTMKVNNKLDALRDKIDSQRKDFLVEDLQLQMLKGRMTRFVNQIRQKIQEVLRLKAKYRKKLSLINEQKQMRVNRKKKIGRRSARRITGELKINLP